MGLTPGGRRLDSDWSTGHLLMGHASLTDVDGEQHRFSEVLRRQIPMLGGFATEPAPRIAWCRGPAGSPGIWWLDWNGNGFDLAMEDVRRGFALALATDAAKPLVFQGPGGYSPKSNEAGSASQYYSFTRLSTEGTILLDGESFRVSGDSWMDHEFGTGRLGTHQVGWDWFGLQLDDGSELMLARLRRADGATDFAAGTWVDAAGGVSFLETDGFLLEPRGSWTSSTSGVRYPAGFRIVLTRSGRELTVEPRLANQENVSRRGLGLHYWEGAVDVLDAAGRVVGRGYAELTGYGENNRPSF